jgi:hypothetical protein
MTSSRALPEDIKTYVAENFAPTGAAAASQLLAEARDHAGQEPDERLLRCALVYAAGDIGKLKSQLERIAYDYRDVIVEGEYAPRQGKLVRVLDLNRPFGDPRQKLGADDA